jgi:TPR repeat protein
MASLRQALGAAAVLLAGVTSAPWPAAGEPPAGWLRLPGQTAVQDGPGAAHYRHGVRLEQGLGLRADPAAAIGHYCRAAHAGHLGARHQLGWMLLHGRGVAPDAGQAVALLRQAAQAGHAPSQGVLRLLPRTEPTAPRVCDGHGPVDRPVDRLRVPDEVERIAERTAARHAIDPDLVVAIIAVESSFDPTAVSQAGAEGLMQLMPATAARFGVDDSFDPVANVQGGVRYLAWLFQHFGDDLDRVLAAYNAGEGAVARYGGIPPFAETQAYVRKVRRLYDPAATPRPQPAAGRQQAADVPR